MISKAKVSFAAVKAFEQASSETGAYSVKFDRGISCLEELFRLLSEMGTGLNESVSNLNVSQEKLAVKIKNIEEIIAKLTDQINELQDELSDLESELAATDAYYTVTDEDGNNTEIPNPAYKAIEAKISAVEGEIDILEAELYPHQQRLEHANSIDSQISSHLDAVEGVIYSLEEKKNSCKQLRASLEDIKESNSRKSAGAIGNLKKIEKIIEDYLKIKMVYENAIPQGGNSASQNGGGININININRTTVVQNPEGQQKDYEKLTPAYTREQIEEHRIKFDENNRICEYEGREYGGKFNTYKDRIDASSADNTIYGHYDGVRGESKFIPSDRTVEGVVVKEILAKYGLDGIVYRNAEPDFEVCAEAVVTIQGMTENRDNYCNADGVQLLGNFAQADIECAKLWNFEEKDGRRDWTARDIYDYRKKHGLTWHEKCDTKTVVMVAAEINLYFKHIGGCSECKLRDSGSIDGGGFDE